MKPIALQRGDAASYEFSVWMLPLAVMVALIGAVAVIRPAQLPVWIAARECARAAISTLDPSRGFEQGAAAALNSLRGNHLSAASARVDVSYGAWDRGAAVTCRVDYSVDVSGIPLVQGLFGALPMSASVTLQVEPYKARWGE